MSKTPAQLAAEAEWAANPRQMTDEAAAELAVILPGGDAEEGREAA
jgi:hypothetical protein